MDVTRGSDDAADRPASESARHGTQGEARRGRRRTSTSGRVTARGSDAEERAEVPVESLLDERQGRVKGRRKDPGPTRPDAAGVVDEDADAPEVPPTDPFGA